MAREVREEVGIEVANIRYFGSQPWPFPNSLMLGFTADYAGGEIRIDDDEIVGAEPHSVADVESCRRFRHTVVTNRRIANCLDEKPARPRRKRRLLEVGSWIR